MKFFVRNATTDRLSWHFNTIFRTNSLVMIALGVHLYDFSYKSPCYGRSRGASVRFFIQIPLLWSLSGRVCTIFHTDPLVMVALGGASVRFFIQISLLWSLSGAHLYDFSYNFPCYGRSRGASVRFFVQNSLVMVALGAHLYDFSYKSPCYGRSWGASVRFFIQIPLLWSLSGRVCTIFVQNAGGHTTHGLFCTIFR